MSQPRFGQQFHSDVAAAIPMRRVLLGRCRSCHTARAYFVVHQDHTASSEEVLARGNWREVDTCERACPACQTFHEPPTSAMRAALLKAYDRSADGRIATRPRPARRRRHASAAELELYEQKLRLFNAEKHAYLADPTSFRSWVLTAWDEEGGRALAVVDV